MTNRRRSRETRSARVLGAVCALALAGALVFLGRRLGVDRSFVAGALAGLVIGLAWRPARRRAEAALHPVAFGPGRRGPAKFWSAVGAYFVPPLTSPLVALLIGLVDARAALVALVVAFGESALRLVLGFDPGPGAQAPSAGVAGERS